MPEQYRTLLNMVSESYDHFERDRRMIERSIEISSKDMVELNTQLKKEKEYLKIANKELEASFAILETIIESTADGILVTDLGGHIVKYNEKFKKLWGIPADMLDTADEHIVLENALTKLVKPDEFLSRVNELYADYKAVSNDIVYFKDGRVFEQYSQPHMMNDEYVGRVWSFYDVTERKKAEKEIQENNKRLNELNHDLQVHAKELVNSNAELEQFAYVASHDLQEPLRMVSSFLTQIEKKYADVLDEKGKTYISFAVDGARRMRQIILDLLEFSRVGRAIEEQETINMEEMIKEVEVLLRKEIKEKNASVTTSELPVIKLYRTPLRQIFQNLISNALKYSRKDEPAKIHISVKHLKNQWQFAIADNGIGIDEQYFDKIFIIFQRLHNKNEYSGTGMGLAVTKKIVENLGGKIWLESTEGKGSTFYFSIPAGDVLIEQTIYKNQAANVA